MFRPAGTNLWLMTKACVCEQLAQASYLKAVVRLPKAKSHVSWWCNGNVRKQAINDKLPGSIATY